MPLLPLLFKIALAVLATAEKLKKKKKGIQIRKEEVENKTKQNCHFGRELATIHRKL